MENICNISIKHKNNFVYGYRKRLKENNSIFQAETLAIIEENAWTIKINSYQYLL